MERYNRNILIEDFGEEGQKKLREARVLVIGAGGLGSPVLFYLAAVGIGTLGIIDCDIIDITNLQRQILHTTPEIGKEKVISAAEKLKALNPDTKIFTYKTRVDENNIRELVKDYDFVMDCSDNYITKYLINDVCVELEKPYSHGSVIALRGEVMTYTPGNACYRCIFGNPPKDMPELTSAKSGILGASAGIIGTIQAAEAIKYFTGIGSLLTNRLLIVDIKNMKFNTLEFNKNENCRCEKK